MQSHRLVIALIAVSVTVSACTDEPPLYGPPTETVCPPTSNLTYQDFGQPFMERYCTRCHSSLLQGKARRGAPSFHDFDTVQGIRAIAEHIDLTTASGPAATNTTMPSEGARPTLAERAQLGEWLACGSP